MSFFKDKYVLTDRCMLIWDGISRPENRDDGTPVHSVRLAIKKNAPCIAELDQIAKAALNGSEFNGTLPPGGNWPLTTEADVTKLTQAVANCLSVGAATTQGVPQIYDEQGNELSAMQYRSMLYPGAIVQCIVHAYAYNNKQKGVSFGLDGIQIVDATRPRLPVGGGLSSDSLKAAFTGQPAPDGPANHPPLAATSTMPAVTMTEKANGMSLEQFQANGWTIDQLVENGYAVSAAPTPAAPAVPGYVAPAVPVAPAPDFANGPATGAAPITDNDIPF